MRAWMILPFLLLVASAAQAANLSLAFGTHELETIEFKTERVKDRSVWVGTYDAKGIPLAKRVIPLPLAKMMTERLQQILKDNAKDLPPWSSSCAGRLVYVHETKRQVFCSTSASVLAKKRISEWIRDAQEILEVRRAGSPR